MTEKERRMGTKKAEGSRGEKVVRNTSHVVGGLFVRGLNAHLILHQQTVKYLCYCSTRLQFHRVCVCCVPGGLVPGGHKGHVSTEPAASLHSDVSQNSLFY